MELAFAAGGPSTPFPSKFGSGVAGSLERGLEGLLAGWSARRRTLPTCPFDSITCSRREKFENNYFTEMCSGSEAGSYLRLIDFVYHSTLGVRLDGAWVGGLVGGLVCETAHPPHLSVRQHHLYRGTSLIRKRQLRGYLAHKKTPPPLGPS